jgi:diguanylate cyclase (GGDEF)-like protein
VEIPGRTGEDQDTSDRVDDTGTRGIGILKRVPISYQDFLRKVVATAPLTWEEQALLECVLRDGHPGEMEQATRGLVESLVERGKLVVMERTREGGHEWLQLRDPDRKLRARLRLSLHPRGPEARTVALPLDPSSKTGFRYHEVHSLLAIQGSLVSHDRVLAPRDLVQRMETTLQDLVPSAGVSFHPLEMPSGEDWPVPAPGNGLPVPLAEQEPLARQRDRLILFPDLGKDGSCLLEGLGDEGTGWRGLLVLRHPDREHFTRERLAVAHLVAQHFQMLISASIRLQGLIFYDFLTGVYNRSYFEEQLEREIAVADRRGQSLALVIVDIDDFKSFNTRYGYEGGDRVLATVACVLKSALRHTDTLARYGGEEFAAILSPPVPLEEARLISERLRSEVAAEPLTMRSLDRKTVAERVTVSVGGVLYPSGGRTVRDLWNSANRLLLEAKARGKNQVRFAGDD